MNAREIAEAFSGHRFDEVFDHLSPAVRWVLPGHRPIEGKDAVVAVCEESAAELAALAGTEYLRFVCVADDRVAAVDAIGRYVDADGGVSVVSSADVYELDATGLVATITSYTVEIEDPS